MSDKAQTEKRPFDPAMSFTFFGSWFETLERLKESQGVEAAYNLFEAIANYSRYYDAPNFEDGSIAQIFWPMIQREIDLSLKRRGANFSSEKTEERRQKVISAHLDNPSLTVREIEELTSIPKSTVNRILQKWADDREAEQEIEKEIDTMGLGRDGTVGQPNIDPLNCSSSDWGNLAEGERKEFSLLDRIQARIASADDDGDLPC
ncbi:MAG: MarR family transcriptional regulator [Flavonifractor sp.]|jgi:hypothetical protein|nr:MarR family transcriptional regulator [Flavonifractor sp.]